MHDANVSEDICLYISHSDFIKLISEPGISEDDVKFHEAPSLNKVLSEFGLQF